jgi:hypothetical protein
LFEKFGQIVKLPGFEGRALDAQDGDGNRDLGAEIEAQADGRATRRGLRLRGVARLFERLRDIG